MRLWVTQNSAVAQASRPKRVPAGKSGGKRTSKKNNKQLVQHWRKLLTSNELRRSVMLRNVLGPKGRPGASAINDTVLSGHFDSLSTQGSPMPECWRKRLERTTTSHSCALTSHPLAHSTDANCAKREWAHSSHSVEKLDFGHDAQTATHVRDGSSSQPSPRFQTTER